MKMTQLSGRLGVIGLTLALAGCAGTEQPAAPEAVATLTATAIPTQAILAPTLPPITATTVANLAPTALPAPTEIVPPTAAPADPNQPGGSGGPSMTINPGIGEPGDVIVVTGSGFVAGEKLQFHWNVADDKAPTGPVYYETTADANGTFNVPLIVPPADKWPGGPPTDRSLIQLRVTAESMGFNFKRYNFTYVKRFDPNAVAPSATPEPPTVTPTP